MNYISLETLMNDIRDSINLLSKHNFDLVVGIPRSGMIPAYLISLYLNIDVTDVNSFILNTPIQEDRLEHQENAYITHMMHKGFS